MKILLPIENRKGIFRLWENKGHQETVLLLGLCVMFFSLKLRINLLNIQAKGLVLLFMRVANRVDEKLLSFSFATGPTYLLSTAA